ncbi:MAG: YraN family protein, partial [Minisyncoccales bacterium]
MEKNFQNQGEKLAEEFLRKKGYKILKRNYLFWPKTGPERGEIDLVCKKGNVIVFVEVKSLSNKNPYFFPELKINYLKKRRIIQSA